MAKNETISSYDSLEEHEGLEYLRRRAYVNMGSTSYDSEHNSRAQVQMAQEILSNSYDEAINGFGDKIDITINEDNSMTVSDHGRGIPKDLHTIDKKTGKKVIIPFQSAIGAFTKIGTGGKFGTKSDGTANYAYSGGLNAIGAKGTTALSEYVEVEAQTASHEHYTLRIDYDKFTIDNEPTYTKELPYDKKLGTFTKVTFKPDIRAFKPERDVKPSVSWMLSALKERYEMTAYLAPRTKITLTDFRVIDHETGKPKQWKWFSENGLDDYVDVLAKESSPLKMFKDKHIKFDDTEDAGDDKGLINVHGSILWTESTGYIIKSFANGVPTAEGGHHVDGLNLAVRRAINDYISDTKVIKGKLDSSDILDGLVAAIEVKIPENMLQFEGQTKEKLGTAEARDAANAVVKEAITRWLYDNPKDAEYLIKKMNESKSAREAAIKARKEAKAARDSKKNGLGKLMVSSKLVSAIEKDPKKRELFIVEGDSAVEPVKEARNPNQAIFPLRGKLKNTLMLKLQDILKNVEISTIVSVLGSGVSSAYEEKDLQYNKVIILTDADDDGDHIKSLNMVFFYKFMPELIKNGHLYIVKAPLYRLSRYEKGKQINAYAFSKQELEEKKEAWAKFNDVRVTRFKGLGESNASDLKASVIDPATRHLIRVTMHDAEDASKSAMMTMGDNPNLRRDWVRDNLYITPEDLEAL